MKKTVDYKNYLKWRKELWKTIQKTQKLSKRALH